jgi:hypothetical protein
MIHIRWQGGVNAKAEQISGAERVGLVQQKSCKEVCIGTQAEGSTYCVQTLFLIHPQWQINIDTNVPSLILLLS